MRSRDWPCIGIVSLCFDHLLYSLRKKSYALVTKWLYPSIDPEGDTIHTYFQEIYIYSIVGPTKAEAHCIFDVLKYTRTLLEVVKVSILCIHSPTNQGSYIQRPN